MKRSVKLVLSVILVVSLVCGLAFAHEAYHTFGQWRHSSILGERHCADCVNCSYTVYMPCSALNGAYGSCSISVCPVCGNCNGERGSVLPAKVTLYDYGAAPLGELLVMQYDSPAEEIKTVFSVIFEYAGEISAYDGAMKVFVTVDLPESSKLIRLDNNAAEIPFTYEDGVLSFDLRDKSGLFAVIAE